MAKKAAKTAPTSASPLAGKRVAFVGKFGYQDMFLKHFTGWLPQCGATLVKATGTMDVLVYGDGRGGGRPGDVAKIEKRLPSVETMSLAEFARNALPEPATVAAEARQGTKREHDYWQSFGILCRLAGTKFDFAGASFLKGELYGASLSGTNLSGCDFREAKLHYVHLNAERLAELDGARFDGADLENAYMDKARACSFRGANLNDVWGDRGEFVACDFRDATLCRFRADDTKFAECDFRGAKFADAEMERVSFSDCDLSGATLTHIHAKDAKFTGCKFGKANLQRAYLAGASLKNADLRGADLSNAVLTGADLTGAQVAGANFHGTTLTGATIKGVDFSKAKNYTPPVASKPGPKVTEFQAAAKGAKQFHTTAEVELGPNEHASLRIDVGGRAWRGPAAGASRYYRDGEDAHDWIDGKTLAEVLANMAGRWPNTTLRLDTITAKGSKTVRGAKLQALAVAAWSEAFGVPLATEEELAATKQGQAADALKKRDELAARMRTEGVAPWNDLGYRERDRLDFRGIDLHGAPLAKWSGWGADFTGSNFAGAKLAKAQLWGGRLADCDFTDAAMTGAELQGGKCENALFVRANLTKADLTQAKLQGADFTDATLTGAKLDKAQFDEHTKFPKGFRIPAEMVWKGKGPRPGLRVTTTAAGSLTFTEFVKGLPKKVDAGRIQKARAMLKAEKFQLFADVTDTHLVGVVKSQSSKELVYSCRLGSDGSFCCGTQNLKPCGGLSGALCKHLLVLIVGLAKAGKLDPATAANWVGASKAKQPVLDKDALSETFLKHKGAEAGDIDWRPTETLPEDFYTA